MKEKEQLFKEHHFLERFQKLYDPIKKLKFVKTESPDFITTDDNNVSLGIEITELVNQKEPSAKYSPAQRNSLEKKIVEIAKQEFLRTYNIPLHVSFWFRDDISCKKGQEDKIAVLLKNLIWD